MGLNATKTSKVDEIEMHELLGQLTMAVVAADRVSSRTLESLLRLDLEDLERHHPGYVVIRFLARGSAGTVHELPR